MDAITDTKKVATTDRIYPKVMGWALAELTEEEQQQQKLEIKEILASVHAETAKTIAAEENEVEETCPTCGHTKNPKRSSLQVPIIPPPN